jgi:hypothetical protein
MTSYRAELSDTLRIAQGKGVAACRPRSLEPFCCHPGCPDCSPAPAAADRPTIDSANFDPEACPVYGCKRKWSARAVIETKDGQRRVQVGCLHHLHVLVGARTQGFIHPDNDETADGRPL